MNRLPIKWLVCMLAVAATSCAYAQAGKQVIKSSAKALSKKTVAAEGSALKALESWHNAGAALKNSGVGEALNKSFKRIPHPMDSRDHAFRNSGFFNPIIPTPLRDLRINLIHPTSDQVQQVVNEYRNLMRDFEPVRKEVTTKLLYKTLPNDKWSSLLPQERREMILQLSSLHGRAVRLHRVVLSKDEPLAEIIAWTDKALQVINPFHVPNSRSYMRTDNRVFKSDEFFLKYPKSSDLPEGVKAPERVLPANLRVAVLNDQEDILDMYKIWERQGRLGEGWKVSTYTDTRELIRDLESGLSYDLIITDLTVPGGGGYFLVDQVRNMRLEVPVIGCSMYTFDKLNAQKMFEQGFDGYIYGDDMFEEVSGSVTWVGYIKNYYYYKNLYGWSR